MAIGDYVPARNFTTMNQVDNRPSVRVLGRFIFLSRWLQAPLYLGLIVTQLVYVYLFVVELVHLVGYIIAGHGPKIVAGPNFQAGVAGDQFEVVDEQFIMIRVLSLIDVVMIANLLVMVIVGGYETFVSRLRLEGHPDQPEWLSHVNAGVLKVKLATALIGISSIHLLRSFIEIGTKQTPESIYWQVVVHLTFVVSALILAYTDRITTLTSAESRKGH